MGAEWKKGFVQAAHRCSLADVALATCPKLLLRSGGSGERVFAGFDLALVCTTLLDGWSSNGLQLVADIEEAAGTTQPTLRAPRTRPAGIYRTIQNLTAPTSNGEEAPTAAEKGMSPDLIAMHKTHKCSCGFF